MYKFDLSSSPSYGSSINNYVVPKRNPIFKSFTRLFNQPPSISTNNYGTVQDQPIVTSQSSLTQLPTVNINQQTPQYGQSYSQQPQSSFVPQQSQSLFIAQQPMRSFNRVFQPESTRNWNVQPTSSGYRR